MSQRPLAACAANCYAVEYRVVEYHALEHHAVEHHAVEREGKALPCIS